MIIPEKKIKALQELYKKRFGKEIDESEARKIGEEIIRFLRSVYSPMNKTEFQIIKSALKK